MPAHAASRAEGLTVRHLEAWSVEMLGDEADVQGDTIAGLVTDKLLRPSDARGLTVRGMRHPVDPWLFAVLTGTLMGQAEPADAIKMRSWSMRRWQRAVDDLIDERLRTMQKGLSDWLRAAASGVAKLLTRRRASPGYLTPAEDANWQATKTRVANHITKLSTAAKADVREMVRNAVQQGLTRSQLMLQLSSKFRGQTRDWLRVARTEMQAAHNEAAAAATIERDGVVALIAMVPEHDACEHCIRLYLDGSGKPRIWSLSTLIANGTNWGKKPAQWLATLYPLHSNCRCSPQRVPQDHKFNSDWSLVAA